MKKSIFVAMAVLVAGYLLVSFVALDVRFWLWEEHTRLCFAFFGFFASVLGGLLASVK